ncbi:MAG: CvpA family protein [Ignavibacteriaceae bacterium]|nr:CvpA family protein [Ignavibacteriaceae bacterium]
MILLDILIIAGVIIGFILGFKDGFIRKLVGLIGFILAVVAAVFFAGKLGLFIESLFRIEYYLAEIIGGIFIFISIMTLFVFLKRVVHPFDKVNNLINQIAGGVVGALQILFFLSVIFIVLNIFDLPDNKTKKESLLYTPTLNVIHYTIQS